jgi:hypothetical protein
MGGGGCWGAARGGASARARLDNAARGDAGAQARLRGVLCVRMTVCVRVCVFVCCACVLITCVYVHVCVRGRYQAMKSADPGALLSVGGLDCNWGVTGCGQYIADLCTCAPCGALPLGPAPTTRTPSISSAPSINAFGGVAPRTH